jgi:hypothetical protein
MRSPKAVTRNSRSGKVGKADYERTSAGTRGNDEDAPISDLRLGLIVASQAQALLPPAGGAYRPAAAGSCLEGLWPSAHRNRVPPRTEARRRHCVLVPRENICGLPALAAVRCAIIPRLTTYFPRLPMLHAIRRFCLLLGPVYVFASLLTIRGTEAITFSKGAPQACDVVVDGEILKGDFEVFVTRYNNSKFERVCLNSPGGSYFDGIKIARFINDTRISTRVRADGECYSACAIIFMAGITEVGDFEYRDRTLEPGGTIGFHAPYPVMAAANLIRSKWRRVSPLQWLKPETLSASRAASILNQHDRQAIKSFQRSCLGPYWH